MLARLLIASGWKPVEKAEIYSRLGIIIWMRLDKVAQTHWNIELKDAPIDACVARAMSRTMWEQIYRSEERRVGKECLE